MKQQGFTLVELMITVAIVAILASIALPSYQDSVRQTHRATAQADLMELAGFMERFFTENNRYDQTNAAPAVNIVLPANISHDHYNFSLTASSAAASYILQAVPVASGPQSSDSCGTMTVSNTGAKTSASNCW